MCGLIYLSRYAKVTSTSNTQGLQVRRSVAENPLHESRDVVAPKEINHTGKQYRPGGSADQHSEKNAAFRFRSAHRQQGATDRREEQRCKCRNKGQAIL